MFMEKRSKEAMPALNEHLQWMLCDWIEELCDAGEVYEMLGKVKALDNEVAMRLEEAINAHLNQVAEAGFVVGWQCREEPGRLVFGGRE